MNTEMLFSFCKFLVINLCIFYTYTRIIHVTKIKLSNIIQILTIILALSFFDSYISNTLTALTRIFMIYFICGFLFALNFKIPISNSLFATAISLVITYTTYLIGSIISSFIVSLFDIQVFKKLLLILFTLSSQTIFIISLFKIKKFKNGFHFLKTNISNNYISLVLLIFNIIMLFTYFLIENYDFIDYKNLIFTFISLIVILIPLLQKTFTISHKQKLQLQALKDYEQELSATKQKLETALAEKEKIVKSNHEFYHRQEALNKKLDNLINLQSNSMNAEFSNEYSDILDRLNTLSSEYKTQTTVLPILDKTNITEIDDMLIYMQSECAKNNIEFILKINCDINHIINNFITKSQLETLLGDLIRNAIIAINHSSSSFKSVMVIFGIKEESYELCIYDSGIPFEIETLINLGLHPASTHLDDGGTGIGFITTFEAINSCNASFIINEITNNNYTKSLEIKFDNKNEYVIFSNRLEDIRKANILNRDIVLK